MVQLHSESSDNSGWGGPQEVSSHTSCSKQSQLSDKTWLPGAISWYILENSKVGNSTDLCARDGNAPWKTLLPSFLPVAGVESTFFTICLMRKTSLTSTQSALLSRPAMSLPFHIPAHKQLTLLPFPAVALKGSFKSILVQGQMFAECSVVLLRRCYQNKFFSLLLCCIFLLWLHQSVSQWLNRVVAPAISCHKVPGDQRSSCFSVWVLDDLSMFKVKLHFWTPFYLVLLNSLQGCQGLDESFLIGSCWSPKD